MAGAKALWPAHLKINQESSVAGSVSEEGEVSSDREEDRME
jgi:hypothetical protein